MHPIDVIFLQGLTDPNTVNPSGEVEPPAPSSSPPSFSSQFYTASLPAQPLRNLAADHKVGAGGGGGGGGGGQAVSQLSSQSCVLPRQDLDQITTFSEILDSLNYCPSEKEKKELSSVSRPKDMMYMAPLGPSQVDIGNLSCR